MQDVALKLLRSDAAALSKDFEHFKSMAYTAARWATIDRFRKGSSAEISTDPGTIEEMSPSHTPDLAATLAFKQAWALLSPREQQVLEMRHNGLSDEEIATALKMSSATVRSIARRAKIKAADILF